MVAAKQVHTNPIEQFTNRMNGMQRQIDELTRRSPSGITAPMCRVQLNADVAIPPNAEVFAQASWVVGEDPDNNATLSPTAGTYSYITAPLGGRYLVVTRAVFTSPTAASTMLAFVTVNGTDSNSSVVRDNRQSTTNGSDGTIVGASRPVLLNQGDQLFWGYWSYQACTLSHLSMNVPTEVSIFYIGGR